MPVDTERQRTWGSRVIDAPIDEVFSFVADPANHHLFDGSDTVRAAKLSAPDRLSGGAKFGMKMKFFGVPYQMNSVVKEFEENKVIAWAHFGGHRWRYEFAEVDGGTEVTETFDYSTCLVPKFIELMRYQEQHDGNIERTLERLEEAVTKAAA